MLKPVDAKIPVGLGRALTELGVAPSIVASAAGLSPLDLDDPSARVPVPEYFALWRAIRVVSDDPAIGIRLVQSIRADFTEPLILAVLGARDLSAALDTMARFKRALSPEDLHVSATGDEIVVRYDWPAAFGAPPAVLLDAELAFVLEMARRATGDADLAPRRVLLREAAIDAGGHHAAFFRCPVVLGAAAAALVFASADGRRPFETHNPPLLAALEPHLVATTPSRSTLDEVRAAIGRRLAGRRPSLSALAKELATSTRSLQRLLRESDTTFRALVDEVRNHQAHRYLRATSFSDAEIAYLLGFEDPSSFYRAFRAWNGVAPGTFRAGASAAGTAAPITSRS